MKKLVSLLFVIATLFFISCEKDKADDFVEEDVVRNYDIPVTSSLDIMYIWKDVDSDFYFDLRNTTNPTVGGETFYCYIDKMTNGSVETSGYMFLFRTEKDYKKFIDVTVYGDEIIDVEEYQAGHVYYSIEFDYNSNYFSWETVRFVDSNYNNYFCSKQ